MRHRSDPKCASLPLFLATLNNDNNNANNDDNNSGTVLHNGKAPDMDTVGITTAFVQQVFDTNFKNTDPTCIDPCLGTCSTCTPQVLTFVSTRLSKKWAHVSNSRKGGCQYSWPFLSCRSHFARREATHPAHSRKLPFDKFRLLSLLRRTCA